MLTKLASSLAAAPGLQSVSVHLCTSDFEATLPWCDVWEGLQPLGGKLTQLVFGSLPSIGVSMCLPAVCQVYGASPLTSGVQYQTEQCRPLYRAGKAYVS